MNYEKGSLLNEGKTKKIWGVRDNPDIVIIENKKDITAFDDPSFTKEFETKAIYSTNITCRVFELLRKAGIPAAYQEQVSPTEFLAKKCIMIPLEAVARRFAVGSYLKRHPELTPRENETPHRFHRLVIEFFLKTTEGKLVIPGYGKIVQGLDSQKGEEDPFITNPYEAEWRLFHSKKPSWDSEADFKKSVSAIKILGSDFKEKIGQMENILRKVFLVLEGAWNTMGLRMIDMKIEFGITADGKLIVADVIDNDSWRLRDAKWQELSKEAFRQGEELSEVEKKYGIVSSLIDQIRIPKQVLIFWKGSKSDLSLNVQIVHFDINEIILSGHKSPRKALAQLDKIIGKYPDGGVIIVKVGRSNGLGPMLAARTNWPVIAIPTTIEEYPEDIWSSIRMPSNVPLLTTWPEKNAFLAALNILAQKNPLVYMRRQMQIEELDI
ncbi:AIR carboxylase family protein [Patescibacteria group bacterium]|nr:AIR carboxylase family protein [Patescibacteria group bacterium]MBU2580046.1 AIR carboxylase family protein [Patescibacteria group bacterium]